jgi:hypothetical protein
MDYIEDESYLDNEVRAEEITILDLAISSGFSYKWAQQEILYAAAMMGITALEEDGKGAKTARFTINVDEDTPVEITVRLQDERKKNRLH